MVEKQQSPHFPDSFYRVSVKGLLVCDRKLLLAHDFTGKNDHDKSPEWELPGGGLDFGETPQEGLIREVKEEMGLAVTYVAPQPLYVWSVRKEKRRGLPWLYVLIPAYAIEVKDLNFIPSNECREIKFVSQEELQVMPDLAEQLHPLRGYFDPKDFA